MNENQADINHMRQALRLARLGEKKYHEVPVGAVAVFNDRIIAAGFNHPINAKDPTCHAEIVAIRRAARRLGAYRIPGADLYVTLEPCIMCMGAIIQARIRHLYFAAPDPKIGVISTGIYRLIEANLNHRLEVTAGLLAEEAALMLKKFFENRR